MYKANINIKLKLPNLLGQGSDDKLFIEPKRGARTLLTIYIYRANMLCVMWQGP
jgi:hypothetical protein